MDLAKDERSYELRNVTHVATPERHVGRNSGPIFTICGPKFA